MKLEEDKLAKKLNLPTSLIIEILAENVLLKKFCKKLVTLNAHMDIETTAQLNKIADTLDVSVSAVVSAMLKRMLRHEGN